MKTVLVTGASGFIGSQVVPLLKKEGHQVIALCRCLSEAKDKSIEWVEGNIQNGGVLSNSEDLEKLKGVTDILHLAALYDLTAKREDLYKANVIGTQNMMALAESLPKLERFHHVSTLAIAGDYCGSFFEKDFDKAQSFTDPYASTKFESEKSIRTWKISGVQRLIYRLGIVVGDSQTGFIPKVDGPYYLWRALRTATEKFPLVKKIPLVTFPFNESSVIHLVPVDAVAKGLVLSISKNKRQENLVTYHLTGESGGIPPRQILEILLGLEGFKAKVVELKVGKHLGSLTDLIGIPRQTLAYMYSGLVMENQEFLRDFPEFSFPLFKNYASSLQTGAVKYLFGGKK